MNQFNKEILDALIGSWRGRHQSTGTLERQRHLHCWNLKPA